MKYGWQNVDCEWYCVTPELSCPISLSVLYDIEHNDSGMTVINSKITKTPTANEMSYGVDYKIYGKFVKWDFTLTFVFFTLSLIGNMEDSIELIDILIIALKL